MKKLNSLLIRRINKLAFSDLAPPPENPQSPSDLAREISEFIGGRIIYRFAARKISEAYKQRGCVDYSPEIPGLEPGPSINVTRPFPTSSSNGPFCSCVPTMNGMPVPRSVEYTLPDLDVNFQIDLSSNVPDGYCYTKYPVSSIPYVVGEVPPVINLKPAPSVLVQDGVISLTFGVGGPLLTATKYCVKTTPNIYDFSDTEGKPISSVFDKVFSSIQYIEEKARNANPETALENVGDKLREAAIKIINSLELDTACDTDFNKVRGLLESKGLLGIGDTPSQYLIDLWDRLIYDPLQTGLGFGGQGSGINCISGIRAFNSAVQEEFRIRLNQVFCTEITEDVVISLFENVADELARSDRFQNWDECP